jgi:hypothetical protein
MRPVGLPPGKTSSADKGRISGPERSPCRPQRTFGPVYRLADGAPSECVRDGSRVWWDSVVVAATIGRPRTMLVGWPDDEAIAGLAKGGRHAARRAFLGHRKPQGAEE